MYKLKIEQLLKKVVKDLDLSKGSQGFGPTDIVCSIPENPKFGDYSWNGALQLAKQKGSKNEHSSLEIANEILEKFGHPEFLERIEVAGPGFLNFYLKDESLVKILVKEEIEESEILPPKLIVEYADPNTHKAFHIGHLRTLSIGESISRLLEYQGSEIFRTNYGSDIGPTVAKALYGVQLLKAEYEAIKHKSLREKAEFLGKAYALAHEKYESEKYAKSKIEDLNQKLYSRDPEILPLWEETKAWSLAYFETIYSLTGTEFDLRVNESEIDEVGKKIVESNIGTVFEKDEGAIIFPGEKYGLHNRVFITSAGYPTYEGKEVGLVEKYQEVYPFDEIIILSDVQQAGFFEVVNKAIELIHPHLLGKKKYLGFGFVSLSTGKMSSRKGNVMTAEDLIENVAKEIKEQYKTNLKESEIIKIAIAAIKFAYLKYSLSSDIAFDIKKSVSLQGDSGPYLLYAYARINSILSKATDNRANQFKAKKELDSQHHKNESGNIAQSITEFEEEERDILRHLEYFESTAELAARDFKPNELANYLLDLAKAFNSFYEKYPILSSNKEEFRLLLIKKVGEYLKLGLYLLGIETVDRM